MLKTSLENDSYSYEIGVDEVGRGPLFGRVYAAAVILPNEKDFDHSQMKDSKKFHSEKKIQKVAEYIKEHALYYDVQYLDEKQIDKYNILRASQMAMGKAIKNVLYKLDYEKAKETIALIDGNQKFMINYEDSSGSNINLKTIFVEQGDNTYSNIAAASILAKVERDKYIAELCEENPYLIENYGIQKNKGYGTKQHLQGIKDNGISPWHRKTFGICKTFS